MVICSEKFGNLLVNDLKKNEDSVIEVHLKDLYDGLYCVTAIVYRVSMNPNEISNFVDIAKGYGVELRISTAGDYFRFEYY